MDNTLKKDITSQSNTAIPTISFTEEHMGNLLTAYQSLRELEKLLTIISGIDPENGILCRLRYMDKLIQDLSPLFAPSLDYDQQAYTKVLENDSPTDFSSKKWRNRKIRDPLNRICHVLWRFITVPQYPVDVI